MSEYFQDWNLLQGTLYLLVNEKYMRSRPYFQLNSKVLWSLRWNRRKFINLNRTFRLESRNRPSFRFGKKNLLRWSRRRFTNFSRNFKQKLRNQPCYWLWKTKKEQKAKNKNQAKTTTTTKKKEFYELYDETRKSSPTFRKFWSKSREVDRISNIKNNSMEKNNNDIH